MNGLVDVDVVCDVGLWGNYGIVSLFDALVGGLVGGWGFLDWSGWVSWSGWVFLLRIFLLWVLFLWVLFLWVFLLRIFLLRILLLWVLLLWVVSLRILFLWVLGLWVLLLRILWSVDWFGVAWVFFSGGIFVISTIGWLFIVIVPIVFDWGLRGGNGLILNNAASVHQTVSTIA